MTDFGSALAAAALGGLYLLRRRQSARVRASTGYRVTQLIVYPLKSGRGINLSSANVGLRGLLRDREWMVVTEDGLFMSQRAFPKMALIDASLPEAGDGLNLAAPGMDPIHVPIAPYRVDTAKDVTVWDDTCKGDDQGDGAAAWLTAFIGHPCRLVRMSPYFVRATDAKYSNKDSQTGFSDGFPVLVISEESLADLNSRLVARGKAAIPMDRFRPNIVVKRIGSGPSMPFAEDFWGEVTFIGKGADKGTMDLKEPTATMRLFRSGKQLGFHYRWSRPKWANELFFGQNLVAAPTGGTGALRVGDELRVDSMLTAAPRR